MMEEKVTGRKQQVRKFLGLGIGFLFVLGVEQLYNIRSGGDLFSNSVLSLLLFGMAAYLTTCLLREPCTKRDGLLAAFGGLVFVSLLSMGYAMNRKDTMWMKEVFWAILFMFPFVSVLIIGLFRWVEKHSIRIGQEPVLPNCFFHFWGLLLLLWLPALLAAWPGLYGYDSSVQLREYMSGLLSSHHPVLHTWLLGITMKAGQYLFHSNQAGALLYTLVQMGLFSAMLAYVLYKFQVYKAPGWLRWGAFLFYSLHPINSLMALAATKDVLFSGVTALLLLQLFEIAREPVSFFHSRRRIIIFCAHILAALALRNNAFHALLLCAPFFVWSFRKFWKRAAVILCACLALHIGITGPGYRLLGIEKGDPREMCSLLMQTAARAYTLVYLDLTEEEKEGLFTVIREEGLQSYLPHFADPVKAHFNGKGFVENPKPFLRAWYSIGKRYSKLYVDAVLSNTLGYWYPGASLPDGSGQVYLECWVNGPETGFPVEQKSKLPGLWKWYKKIGEEAVHQEIPVVSLAFSIGTFVWILLAGLLLVWQQKKYWAWVPLLPLGFYLFTLLFGPVVKIRYAYPVIVCLPIILYAVFVENNRKKDE